MRFPRLLVLLALLALAALAVTGPPGPVAAEEETSPPAGAAPAEILPLSDVRPGMRGYGLTVFSGTRLERFEVEVLDVMHNFLAKQDVILVRCLGERMQHVGVAEGFSGSPVYVEGKLVGALAYTWGWSKEALAGITPIEAMLAEGERPLEGRPRGAAPPTKLRTERAARVGGRDLVPIGTPVCVGGFSLRGRAEIEEAMGELGLDVRTAGGGEAAGAPGGWADRDAPVVPGSAVAVEVVRGDFTIAAIGTCTHVDGDKVYAFGHGFQDVGETLYPLSAAYVYTVVPSRNLSFKLGSAMRPVGALVQDRPSGIVGVLGREAPMVPFDVTMENAATGRKESFQFEVTANTILFQRMMIISLREAFAKAESTLGSNTKKYRLEVKLKGVERSWPYEDTIVGFDSGLSRLLIGLVDRVMIHPSQRAEFEWVKLHVTIENLDRRATIEAVTASKDEVRPGEALDLFVRLRLREGGGLIEERIPVRAPADVRPGNFHLLVTGGDNVSAEVATPVDILDIPKLYDAFYKSTELVAVVPTGRVDLDMDGRLLRNLPLSTVPRLARSANAVGTKVYPVTEKVRRDVPYVVSGTGTIVLRVVP